jgi:GT2 family glycosyltransferase
MKKDSPRSISLPLVDIIILNWNNWQDTVNCVESVQKLDYENYRIIVIDNGSLNDSVEKLTYWINNIYDQSDDTSSVLKISLSVSLNKIVECSVISTKENITFISSVENFGFSGGCNIGIDYAIQKGAEYVFLLNNDASPEVSALTNLVDVANESKASIIGSRIVDETGAKSLFTGSYWPQQLFFSSIRKDFDESNRFWASPDVQGCALLASKQFLKDRFLKYNFFLDPELFLYKEETDLCLSVGIGNGKCVIARDSIVHHALSKSSGGEGNPRTYYYLTRNRIYLANRWLNPLWKILFHLYYMPSRLILIVYSLINKKTYSLKVASAVAHGLFDGYLGTKGKWINH